MDISSIYTQIEQNPSIPRKGGILLRGRARTVRQPIHMILLVDTSGSMDNDNKLSNVQRSLLLMLSLLSNEDRLSLVQFDNDSQIILSRAAITPEETQAITYRVNSLRADGSTNMSAGLLDVRNLVEPASSGRKQGVILLTDGNANRGTATEEGILSIVTRLQSESPGLSFTTVAYGVDHNSDMLTAIAKTGGGAYNVVKNLEDVATVFGDILGGLVSVSAQKVEIQFPPGATVNTQYRTEVHPSGLTTVYIGDIYSEAEISVLFNHAPDHGGIRIKGIDMSSLDQIDTVQNVPALQSLAEIPVSLLIAEYSLQTSTLLRGITQRRAQVQQSEITALIDRIEQDDRIRDHPLKAMLLQDLHRASELCRQGGDLNADDRVEALQHSAYLSMARGLRSNMTPPAAPRRGGRWRTEAIAAAVTSPFSNRLQTQYIQAMSAMSQADPE